jgi:hypothetical protein
MNSKELGTTEDIMAPEWDLWASYQWKGKVAANHLLPWHLAVEGLRDHFGSRNVQEIALTAIHPDEVGIFVRAASLADAQDITASVYD